MRLFYGWIITATTLVTLFVTNGISISGITVFDESLLKEFGWSRGQLKFRDLLTFAIAGALAPLAGIVIDRFGAKRPMMFGAVLLSVSMVAYSRIQSLAGLYAVHTAFAVVLATCGLVVAIVLVSRWFEAKRGTAIGLTLIGTSLGGIVFPPLFSGLIAAYGWRTAMQIIATFPLALAALLAVVVREYPHDVGATPLGAKPGAATSKAELPGMEYGAALRTPQFWTLALAAMMTFYSILAVSGHLFLHLRGLQFDVRTAGLGLSLMFTMGLVGKFLFGGLCDVFNKKRVMLFNLGVMLTGAVCLASMSTALLWPALVLFGLGWGGLYTLLQVMTVDLFGLRSAGRILGTITVLDAFGGGMGPFVTGVLYDRSGSYQLAFTVLAGLTLLALLAATTLRPAQPPVATLETPA